MTSGPTRQVHIVSTRPYAFGDYQLNYLDYRKRRLIPSTRVFQDDVLLYRTNAFGCIGEELEPDTPCVVFFGDSCTHGYQARSFVEQVSIPGCQPVNAGIEGLTLPWIADRFVELNQQLPIVCAAVHSGWHNICYNEREEDFWAAQLDRISGPPVIAHFRLVADINEDAIARGYDEIFANRDNYGPWRGFDYKTVEGRRGFAEAFARFNRFIEAYCRARGRILIDMAPIMAPQTYDDLGRTFLDFIHPSPVVYPAMAKMMADMLSGPISAVSQPAYTPQHPTSLGADKA